VKAVRVVTTSVFPLPSVQSAAQLSVLVPNFWLYRQEIFLWSALARICTPTSVFFFCLGAAGSPLKCKAMLTNLFLTLAAAEFIRIVI
jgi:hypothetical protein